jgi:hypothetical protein
MQQAKRGKNYVSFGCAWSKHKSTPVCSRTKPARFISLAYRLPLIFISSLNQNGILKVTKHIHPKFDF